MQDLVPLQVSQSSRKKGSNQSLQPYAIIPVTKQNYNEIRVISNQAPQVAFDVNGGKRGTKAKKQKEVIGLDYIIKEKPSAKIVRGWLKKNLEQALEEDDVL